MLKEYLIDLFHFSPKKVLISLVLFVFLGLTQGVGLMMVLPLLHVLGLSGSGGEVSGLTKYVIQGFSTLGLPLNLYSVLTVYILLVSAFAVAHRYQTILDIRIQKGFVIHLQNRLYRALSHAEWLFLVNKKISTLAHSITADISRVGQGTYYFLIFLSDLSLLLFHVVVACFLSIKLSLITLVFSAVIYLFLRPLTEKSFQSGKSLRTSVQNQYETIIEHLVGMKTAKSYGAEKQFVDKFQIINQSIEQEMVNFAKTRSVTRMIYEISAVVGLSLYMFFAVKAIQTPIPNLLLLIFIFTRILPRFSAINQNYQYIKNMLPSFSATGKLMEQSEQNQEFAAEEDESGLEIVSGLEFKNVSFRYSESSQYYALENAGFFIPARKITAIVGPSGAGKSTLADLLLGLLKPESGRILLDDREINNERIMKWRHSIGYVPQETFLFHDTIRVNLLWANPSAKEEDLWRALEMAAADDFIHGFPKGLDTIVGDRGIQISGGERQRLALARALLRKPQLLLLDEATSSLDSQSESRIQKAIESLKGKLTIVIIAHRESTIRFAENIIVLDRGKVVEAGEWSCLAGDPESRFSRLFSQDFSKDEGPPEQPE